MIQKVESVPAFDIKQQYATIEAQVRNTVLEVLSSGRYIGGSKVEAFEQQFANYHQVAECVSCNSGTDALYLALRALDIKAGDEIITTSFSFFATSEVISAIGAIPVFIDIDPTTFNLDVNQLSAAITPNTKAIIPVHLFGLPVDMTTLMSIAQRHNLAVIEDCAQATGASWNHQKVGTFGHVGCFSFYPTKNLGACGDGGAIITNDSAIATKLRILREHGSHLRYIHQEIGINSRLDAIQAVILQVKLRYLDGWNKLREKIASYYYQNLYQIPSITLPQELLAGLSAWNQYTIRVSNSQKNGASSNYRDWVRSLLQNQGISTMLYYPCPLHLQPVYKNLNYLPGSLPVSEQACHQVISLPMFPELKQEQQDKVINALKEILI